MYEEQFSKRLAELRTKKGVSARDMSLSIGQNPGYIRAIECGTTFPTMSNFFYICEYLNVTPQEFFNFSEEPSNGMNALTDQLQQFDSEQINALATFIKTIVKNPDLHIMTDYQQFDDLIQLASKASSVINRVELLKNAIDLYCGKILSSADGEHWLIQFAAKYHIAYVGAVNELLKQLNALHSYDLLNQYAARSLAIVPENSRGYYWLIHSLKVQGMDELASNEYQLAKQHLTTEEYKELCTSLGDSCE